MRVLVIDDDIEISNFLKTNLEAEYFAVDTVQDGERGSFLARTNDYDVVIIDNNLPKKNGREVCREIREIKKDVKIIILSVLAGVSIKVELLSMGADDYMTKPFSFMELLVRIKSLLRRCNTSIINNVIQINSLTLDSERSELWRNGKKINLTRKEFMLIECLMKNAGRTVSQGEMMEHVWDMRLDSFSNALKTHINNLRHKIDEAGEENIIKTVSGRGYKIEI